MKRWMSIIAVLAISVAPLKAEVVQKETSEVTTEITNKIAGENIKEQVAMPYLSRELFDTILGEQSLSYLIKENVADAPTLKEVAYALCKMLKEAGVYLPEAEGIADPYISKLVLLGIWQEQEITGETLITSEAWERTYEKALYYKDKHTTFPRSDSKEEQKMVGYRQKLAKTVAYDILDIGKLTKSTQTLTYGPNTYPLYHFADANYVDLATLEALGFTVDKVNQDYVIHLANPSMQLGEGIKSQSVAVKLANESVYYDSLKTYALKGDNTLFIPLRALEKDFQLQVEGSHIQLETRTKGQQDLTYSQGKLVNQSEYAIEVVTTSYYWDGKKMQEEMKREHLEPGESLEDPKVTYTLRGACYITTLVNLVESPESSMKDEKSYGQKIEALLTIYEKAKVAKVEAEKTESKHETTTEELFPAAPVYATLKSATAGLAKGEQVELYREDNGSYTVITKAGKKVTVPRSKLSIPSDQKVTAQPATKAQVEAFINGQNIASSTPYLVWTDLYRQTTYVLKGSNKQWELIKRMPCSTGKNLTPTPRGFFTLQAKVPSFGQSKGYCCKNAYGFIGSTYLYHSILYDKTGSYIIAGKKELGKEKASHGCIRLLPEDSLRLYTSIPQGTKVWNN